MKAWLKSARLLAFCFFVIPLCSIHLLIWNNTGSIFWGRFILILVCGLFAQIGIVWLNDCADVESDRLNHNFTFFSGGSRVLVDGLLERRQLFNAAIISGIFSAAGAMVLGRENFILFLLGAILFWAYSYGPRFSYLGGGEILQVLGLCGVMPLFAWLGQKQDLSRFPWHILWPFFFLYSAIILVTTFPDWESDRRSGKNTFAVLFGQKNTMLFCSAALGIGVWLAAANAIIALLVFFMSFFLLLKGLTKRRFLLAGSFFIGLTLASVHFWVSYNLRY